MYSANHSPSACTCTYVLRMFNPPSPLFHSLPASLPTFLHSSLTPTQEMMAVSGQLLGSLRREVQSCLEEAISIYNTHAKWALIRDKHNMYY